MSNIEPNDLIEGMGLVVQRLKAVGAREYGTLGLSVVQAKMLRYLRSTPPASQADFARATATDPALTGRAIQGLVDAGWVSRVRSTADRRQYVLELTPPGRDLAEKAQALRDRRVEKMTAHLDARDVDDFKRVTAKMLAALEAMYGEGSTGR